MSFDPVIHEMAISHTILRVPVGSTIHGLHIEGSDDRDELAICVEPAEYVANFSPFQQSKFRTAEMRAGHYLPDRTTRSDPSPKSMPGDLDLMIYSLRKYLSMALKGNPTVLIPLFVPTSACLTLTPIGIELQALAPFLLSRNLASSFQGYLRNQRERLLGTRGQKDVQRPDLERAFGFDTKFAMHMTRLAYQGIQILTDGFVSFPMSEPARQHVRDIRNGLIPLADILSEVSYLEAKLLALRSTSSLREEPDRRYVEDWMISAYKLSWTLTV